MDNLSSQSMKSLESALNVPGIPERDAVKTRVQVSSGQHHAHTHNLAGTRRLLVPHLYCNERSARSARRACPTSVGASSVHGITSVIFELLPASALRRGLSEPRKEVGTIPKNCSTFSHVNGLLRYMEDRRSEHAGSTIAGVWMRP